MRPFSQRNLINSENFIDIIFEKTRIEKILYHVTPFENLQSIKKHGLIPNKNSNWDKEYDEYKSLDGVYLSDDLGIISSAIDWELVDDDYYLLVVVKSTAQLWNDEDDIRTWASHYFGENYLINRYLENFLKNNPRTMEEIRITNEKYYNRLVDQFNVHPKKQNILRKIIMDNGAVLFFGMLESQKKHIDPNLLEKFKEMMGIRDSVYDENRRVLEQITKLKLEDKDFGFGGGRINKQIGYSGSPRIVSLISLDIVEDEDGERHSEIIDVEYNKLSKQELDEILNYFSNK